MNLERNSQTQDDFQNDPLIKEAVAAFASRQSVSATTPPPPAKQPVMKTTRTTTTGADTAPPQAVSFTTTTPNPSRGMARSWPETTSAEQEQQQEMDFASLDARRIRDTDPPERPQPQLVLAGHQISTSGNLTVITAQAKAGKTGVVTGIVGAFLAQMGQTFVVSPGKEIDCLGFMAERHEGRAVIVFDTEQSKYDAYQLVQRSLRRSNTVALPENFRCYSLADISSQQRRLFLKAEIERADQECGGVHAVIVDGVADLCEDPNDPAESFSLVEELMHLAMSHDCPLILVLHENPAGTKQSYSKGRGHLGSQLERKAESNLRVEKDAEGISVIFSERCRRASIPKPEGIRFKWDDEKTMHVTLQGTEGESKAARKREEARALAAEVYEGITGSLRWGELKKAMMEKLIVSEKTAERRITEWKQLGLFGQGGGGYVLK